MGQHILSDGSLNIRRWSTFLEFEGSTAYIAEFIVKAITEERDALARQAEALQRENAELREALKEIGTKGRTTGYGKYALAVIADRALLGGENAE